MELNNKESEIKNENKDPGINEEELPNNNELEKKKDENLIEEKKEENKEENKEEIKEEINKEILKNVYGNDYEQIIKSFKEMEDKTKNYFNNIIKELDKKYEEFNSNIHKQFLDNTNKYTNAFKLDDNVNEEKSNLIHEYTKEYLDKTTKIIKMQEQILESIKETIKILINSLDISRTFDDKKPIQNFMEKEFTNIINSWLFIKLDTEKFNFAKSIKNSNLDDYFKEFIYKVCKDKDFIMKIGPDVIFEDELNDYKDYDDLDKNDETILSNICRNLSRLKISDAKLEDDYFNSVSNFPKLNYLKLSQISFPDNKNMSILRKCPKLQKLILNGVNNFEIKNLSDISKNITKLILSNNNFINYDFQNIMNSYIIKSDSMLRNLVLLSFSNNCISKVDLENMVKSNQSFCSLRELDFHKNRINKFTIVPDNFPELKIINCCYNKFARSYFNGYKKILAFLSGNLFLTDINVCQDYYNKLGKQLNEYKISLTYLNLSYLPSEFGKDYFSNIIINDNILISLKKIDLSYNNLTCDTLFNFINNNKGCLFLRKMNLSGNKLDDTFFEKYLNLKLYNHFKRLQKINLNSNLIGGPTEIDIKDLGEEPRTNKEENKMDVYKLRLIYKFIELNKNLSKLYITKNPISSKFEISIDINMEQVSQLLERDKENHYIINCFYSLIMKIKTELLKNEEEKINREYFNLKFDISDIININSGNFKYKDKFIMFS